MNVKIGPHVPLIKELTKGMQEGLNPVDEMETGGLSSV